MRFQLSKLPGMLSSVLALLCVGTARGQESYIAYEVPLGTPGNQDYGGSLGHDFDVDLSIRVTRLGVFDSLSDGLKRTITARLYDRDTLEELASHVFTADEPGDLVGGSRFKDLDEPLELSAGFHGTMSAEGYGVDELNGNTHGGPALVWSLNSGNCSISFVGGARFGSAGAYPATPDGGPPNRYAAGTFQFEPLEEPTPRAGTAYIVPGFMLGNEAFPGPLGMDFNVQSDAIVTRLGVFDDAQDGLMVPITARLWNRDARSEMASLDFTPGDPGELVEGSRFKALDPPLALPAGFHGTITAEGYADLEKNGNTRLVLPGLLTDSGNCLLAFVGSGRRGPNPGEFPETLDRGVPNTYAAGTFEFRPSETPIEVPGAPTGLTVQVQGGRFVLSWTAPAGGLAAEGYNVYRTRGGAFRRINPDLVAATSFTFDPAPILGPDTCFQVRSVAKKLESVGSNEACGRVVPQPVPADLHRALSIPAGTLGNDPRALAFGLEFDVRGAGIVITRLGVFDDAADGILDTLTARLFDRTVQVELASLAFTNDEPGELLGSYRYKSLPSPIALPAGFLGTLSADGFSDNDRAGNLAIGALPLAKDDGSCSIYLSGARVGGAGAFPRGPFYSSVSVPFVAATFEYARPPGEPPAPPGGIAYEVVETTPGDQDFTGVLGLDFIAERTILVTQLGVFDDLSDGLLSPLTATLYNRSTRSKLTSLEFTPEDPGELVGGNRFKALDPPIVLPAGFQGTMAGEGYGGVERNGNTDGGPAEQGWSVNDGGCLISFVGAGRFGTIRNAFPDTVDGGPANRYAGGTFKYELLVPPATVVRDLSAATFGPGDTVAVTLQVNSAAGPVSMLVREVLGGAAQVAEISEGGAINAGAIEWDLAGITARTLSYKLTPASCMGAVNLASSTYKVGALVIPIDGESSLQAAPLPDEVPAAPWSSLDVGYDGGAVKPLGEHAVVARALGGGVKQTRDEFRYTFFPRSGDFEFTARIDCLDDPGGAGHAGLMVRDTLDPFGANAFLALTSSRPTGGGIGTLRATLRRETNAATPRTTSQLPLTPVSAKDVASLPIYLRVKRSGVKLSFERSDDGASFTEIASREIGPESTRINLKDEVLVGLAVSGGGAGDTRASFSAISGPSLQKQAGPTFRRGDVNVDGKIDVTDPVNLLGFLFLGQPKPACLDAGDTDDSGLADISDAVSNLGYQFLGAPPPLDPGPTNCGLDPSAETPELGCDLSCG